MTLSAQLWQANLDLADACLNHPFVRGIGDGTLPRDRFADYVGQDAFFLEAFARAYSIAAAKAPDWKGFQLFHNLAGGVLEELQLHQGYAREWGVDLNAIAPKAATRHYTDFLLATAWGSDSGTTAAAMTPCMRLYGFLGQQLAKDGIPDHPYAQWIETYSGDEFQPLTAELDRAIDRYAEDTREVESAYRYAMRCEFDFFEAAWQGG